MLLLIQKMTVLFQLFISVKELENLKPLYVSHYNMFLLDLQNVTLKK